MAPSEQIGISNANQLRLLKGPSAFTIIVGTGDNVETWTIQKRLLMAHSQSVNTFLQSSNTASNIITLPEHEPKIFEIFVQYLYLGEAAFSDNTPVQVAKAWVLGDKLGCSEFADQALHHLILMHRNSKFQCSPELARFVFEKSSFDSYIQRFVTFQIVVESHASKHVEEIGQWYSVLKELTDFNYGMAMSVLRGVSNRQARLHQRSTSESMYLKLVLEMIKLDCILAETHTGDTTVSEPDSGDP